MPSLQQLAFDLRTDDKRLVTEEDLNTILPSSLNKVDFFIRYYFPKSKSEAEISTTFSSTRFPIACLFDKPRRRFLIHTIPCDLHSAILTAPISKQMPSGWKYTQQIKDLYIYDITSLLDILLILQHFRRLRILSIDIKDKSKICKYFISLFLCEKKLMSNELKELKTYFISLYSNFATTISIDQFKITSSKKY
jgi:hypothetical protein